MRVIPRTAALVLVAALFAPAAAQDDLGSGDGDKGNWPFGLAEGGMAAMRGKDLYNLGLIGAKARDPNRPAERKFETGRRSFSSADAPDDATSGPARLSVEMLLPGGPADTAGLRVGDVIIGAPKSFKDGSLEPIAAAILKAESGKGKGLLSLRVERTTDGKTQTTTIDVAIPQGGKAAAKPTEGAARQKMIDASLAWLAERQDASGGFAETLSGLNGAVCQTSLAGLAWLAGGSDLEDGPYKDNVTNAATFVITSLPMTGSRMGRRPGGPGGTSDAAAAGPSWDQSNWGYAHAAIFLGELYQRSPTDEVRDALIEAGRTLAERQEKTGGWAHGPGGANALGYTELNIVSGLALCGIGLAGQAGYEVPEEVTEKAQHYLESTGGGDGGVAYSGKDGQRGSGNIGRTACCWLGFVDLGLGDSKWAKKMGKYVRSHAGDIFGGHASLMQHIFLAGVAAHAQGGEARKNYWKAAEMELVIARAPDGSFQPRPWAESLSMGSNSDVSFGEVWTTAAWTIVLACEPDGDRPGLPAWMGLKKD